MFEVALFKSGITVVVSSTNGLKCLLENKMHREAATNQLIPVPGTNTTRYSEVVSGKLHTGIYEGVWNPFNAGALPGGCSFPLNVYCM